MGHFLPRSFSRQSSEFSKPRQSEQAPPQSFCLLAWFFCFVFFCLFKASSPVTQAFPQLLGSSAQITGLSLHSWLMSTWYFWTVVDQRQPKEQREKPWEPERALFSHPQSLLILSSPVRPHSSWGAIKKPFGKKQSEVGGKLGTHCLCPS